VKLGLSKLGMNIGCGFREQGAGVDIWA